MGQRKRANEIMEEDAWMRGVVVVLSVMAAMVALFGHKDFGFWRYIL